MVRIKSMVAVILLCLALVSCSTSKYIVPNYSPSAIYAAAQKNMQVGNFKTAIAQLKALEDSDPCGLYFRQIQLDLIYAYYKITDLPMAQTSIERFIRLNPTDLNIDYILYMRGLVNMSLDESMLRNFFGIDCSDRDPKHAFAAFNDFSQLIHRYPNSQYIINANKYLIYLKDRLAKHEIAIVKYYIKRGAYIAAINRIEQMLRKYPDTGITRSALPLMEHAYKQLQLKSQSDKVSKMIVDHLNK